MKIAILTLLVGLAATAHAASSVSGKQNGSSLNIRASDATQIETLALALLVSCDFEAPAEIATEARWNQARDGYHVRCAFTPVKNVTFSFSGRFTTGPASEQTVKVTELLIPISSTKFPDYALVREGDRIRAFAKYRPSPAKALQDVLRQK